MKKQKMERQRESPEGKEGYGGKEEGEEKKANEK